MIDDPRDTITETLDEPTPEFSEMATGDQIQRLLDRGVDISGSTSPPRQIQILLGGGGLDPDGRRSPGSVCRGRWR